MISKILTFVLAFTAILISQQDIRILASNQNSIVIEYTPQFVDTSLRIINEQEFRNIGLSFGYVDESTEWGTPEIPERRLVIGVPSEFGNSIKVISSSYKEIKGKVLPIPRYEKENFLDAAIYEVTPGYFDYIDFPELASFDDYGIVRGLGVQDIRLFPVKFDVNSNTIKLYSKIVFQIDYGNAQISGRKVDDELLKYSIINFDAAQYWVKSDNKLSKVTSSVLSNGQWVKFEASTEGIYKIDRAKLESFGFNVSSIDPRTIKIYNNGGKQLSEKVTTPRPIDLIENAIIIVGEEDGSFDQNDYILFYGRGSKFRDYDPTDKTIKRYNHQFSDKNYFFITSGGANGKRIQTKSSLNTTEDYVQSSTVAFVDYEVDKINLAKSGRQFFGDDFSQSVPTRTYMNKLDYRISSLPVNYKIRFVNGSSNNFTLAIAENSSNLYSATLPGYSTSYTVGVAYNINAAFNGSLPDDRSVLKFTLSSSSVSSVGYLDYFEMEYERELKPVENKIIFFSKDSSAIVEYYLSGFPSSEIKVFDVTDYSNIYLVNPKPGFPSGGDFRFQVAENADSIRKYIAVGNDSYLIPSNPSIVENSDLRGIQDGAKFIIISHKNFLDAANRLKSYRENETKIPISTIVIDIEKIFNEFSCGIQDISAVRDFIKYAYENWQIKPEYFLLMGKGTYDYKNIEGFDDNYIPAWETVESLNFIYGPNSYCTDDFFARVDGEDSIPDLAFGRLTVKNLDQANNYISKVIYYENSSERGNWRNLITLIADDDLKSNGSDPQAEHTRPSEKLANEIIPASFDIQKIYIADYPAVITGNGRRKPSANDDILKIMNQGTLLINYIGHGNPDVWAHEYIFERGVTIPQLKNDKYFFLCAATCDFGYYDIPNFQSGAEDMLFLKNAGSIATFNASRVVFSGANHALNFALMTNLLKLPRETMNLSVPIGYSVFKTKFENHYSVNDQKFHLLGDPTLRLNVPQYFGSIDSVNGQFLNADVQVRALSNTKIAGTILKPDGTKWSEYNGEGLLTVFDSERIKLLEEIGNYPMRIQGGIIFRGRVSVTGGDFEAEFVVPKDISYENKNGKIIFYFFDLESDGLAFTNKIIVGGTDTTAVNDGEGPEIEIFFDNAAYISSYLVGPDPNLIVRLYDETGLNTTGTGVGHKLEGILNKNQGSPIDFTDYFVGELDAGGKKGEINYKFNKMNDGDYSIEVKAWDVFNNFSNEESFFTVVSTNDLVVRDVYNYPNPFTSNTAFTFQHNLTKPVDVKINVYTISGRLVKQLEEKNINQKFVKINWDGRDEDGDQLGNGTYLYKLIVKTTDGEFTQSVLGKMAVVK